MLDGKATAMEVAEAVEDGKVTAEVAGAFLLDRAFRKLNQRRDKEEVARLEEQESEPVVG